MHVTISKMIALAIATAYVIAGFALEKSWTFALTVAAGALLPLALIWFPDKIGKAKGYWYNHEYIDQESPPVLIAFAGWFFLVGLPVVLLLIWR